MSLEKEIIKKRKLISDKLRYFNGVPLFSAIEVNLLAACTRKCSFCPVSEKDFYKKNGAKGNLSLTLYKKILTDISELNYEGLITFCGQSEPLLHKEIIEIIRMTRRITPQAIIELITNGDLLTINLLNAMFEAGLNVIKISMYDGDHQIEYFTNMKNACGLNSNQVILRRRYFCSGNYGILVSSRGGLIDSHKFKTEKKSTQNLPLTRVCYYPYYSFVLDLNGDMLLCSHDYSKKYIIGNVIKNSIWSLWTSEKLQQIRCGLANADRSSVSCKKCDVDGELIGESSFKAWMNFMEDNSC